MRVGAVPYGCGRERDAYRAATRVSAWRSVEEAYSHGNVVTHRDSEGVALSSASAAGTVAGMLQQLEVPPGHRVLEIGAGTGYNAALLARLAGRRGR
jgi:protein-L-isoaspartate(D-aspartate) O-methyltransferase